MSETLLTLFDVPDDAYVIPPAPEELTRGERRKRLVEKRIRSGIHPLGYVALHPDASKNREGPGPRCGGCVYRELFQWRDRTYPKCMLPSQRGDKTVYPRNTGCESSDIRAWWPACRDYEALCTPS